MKLCASYFSIIFVYQCLFTLQTIGSDNIANKPNIITISEHNHHKKLQENEELLKREFLNYGNLTKKYTPDWPSLDSRPLPEWYDEAKIGIFIHWGVFSVPAMGEWFWESWKISKNPDKIAFMNKTQKPGFTYQNFGRDFTAEFFDSDEWAKLFEEAGAKYMVLTSKHHEGYTLWPSKYSFSWNSMDVGPHRDIVGELRQSIETKTTLKFGLYYSLFEWFNRLYLSDKVKLFFTQEYVNNKMIPEIKELVTFYQPEVLWSDGDWEAPETYWNSKEIFAWLFNDSPTKNTIVTNDRWGIGTQKKHGSFFSGSDNYNPGVLQEHKFENCIPLDKESWGFRENAKLEDFRTIEELVREVVMTVSCNGNALINIGPSSRGIIHPIFVERLKDFGSWMKINGEAIYKSRPFVHQNETLDIWYTMRKDKNGMRMEDPDKLTNLKSILDAVYAIVLSYPVETNSVNLSLLSKYVNADTSVTLLGFDGEIEFTKSGSSFVVNFPDKLKVDSARLKVAWTFKINIST